MNEAASSGLAVLRTRLPYVDRRSLSEAWFSALHLADGAAGTSSPEFGPGSGLARTEPAGARVRPAAARRAAPAAAAPPPAARRYAAALQCGGWLDARATYGTALERAAATRVGAGRMRSYAERGTSLTVGIDGSRVQLLLRREGAVLHVVALCRPDAVAAVRRALASAAARIRLRADFPGGALPAAAV